MPLAREFQALVDDIGRIGRDHHSETLIENARANLPFIGQTLRDIAEPSGAKKQAALVISAGPSLRKRGMIRRVLESGFGGTTVAIDGSLAACLREGLVPDYVLTLDPHPTRMVRWFGDPDFAENTRNDDYFVRQDLDVEFRKNAEETNRKNIELLDKHGPSLKVVVSSSAPGNLVARLRAMGSKLYWWNPLVDDPSRPGSLTRRLYDINRLPALNTGGNVGSAAWVFASTKLKIRRIGVLGMDLGYYHDLPRAMTQTYYELIKHQGGEENIDRYFSEFTFPLTGEKFYTDPVYYWYRKNFLQLVQRSESRTFNCTEGGTLFGDGITCVTLEDFLRG